MARESPETAITVFLMADSVLCAKASSLQQACAAYVDWTWFIVMDIQSSAKWSLTPMSESRGRDEFWSRGLPHIPMTSRSGMKQRSAGS
jgi:hypothetical protein